MVSLIIRRSLNPRHEARRRVKANDKLAERHIRIATLEYLTPGMTDEHITGRMKRDPTPRKPQDIAA